MALDILLVEDSDSDALLIERALSKAGFDGTLRRAVDRVSLLDQLRAGRPDIIISDHGLPQFEGRDVLRIARQLPDPPPLILVTGSLDEETAVEYMRSGAADYVLKDRLMRLGPAVSSAIQRDRDRIARERADASRRETERRLSTLVRATNDAIWDLDVLQGTLEVNEGFRALIGYSGDRTPITLGDWHDRIHDADRARVLSGFTSVIDSRANYWTDDYRLRVATGSYAHVLDRGYVMRDDAGRAVRVIGALMDMTERQRLQEQLQQAQKMEAIGRLAGGLAHDFNNVLAAILMSTDLILNGVVSGDAMFDDLREVHAATQRAANLTRQLLAFSRSQVMELRRIDLNDTIANVARMLSRLIGDNIEFRQVLANPLGSVRADANQVDQVVLNLVINARDAMPDGGVLTVETAEVELNTESGREYLNAAPGPYVMLAISDTGIGMDQTTRDRIFEPFFTTKAVGKGTGLGLSTVYGIVRQHGGHIWVYSEPGAGTTFKIYLPRVDGAAEKRAAAAAGPHDLKGDECVLLVEDEERVRDLTRRVLEKHGYSVLAARDPAEALTIASENSGAFDLLISDVMLPGMSGPAMAARIYEQGFRGPNLFLSGYTEEVAARHGILQANSLFLAKPFTPNALAVAVRRALDGIDDAPAVPASSPTHS
ncbi:MAG: response regulator [Gemmatimonadetes bacterium]|nr:response regulator [Gemmatimonadota bacterium]